MNQSPILLNIASHCDKDTFFNLMLVNKKAYQVVRYLLHSAPTVFIPMYDTSGYLPDKVIYKSLKELYTEIHQKEIHRLPKIYDYTSGWIEHPDGKCIECLQGKTNRCDCGDHEYLGIRMVKYISPYPDPDMTDTYKLENEFNTYLSPLESPKGFRISKILYLENESRQYMNTELGRWIPPLEITSVETNYKSMSYLYQGYVRTSFSLKHGVKQYLYKHYYPLTTENIHLFDRQNPNTMDIFGTLYLDICWKDDSSEIPRTI